MKPSSFIPHDWTPHKPGSRLCRTCLRGIDGHRNAPENQPVRRAQPTAPSSSAPPSAPVRRDMGGAVLLDGDAEVGDRVTRRPKLDRRGTLMDLNGSRASVLWDDATKPSKAHPDDLVRIREEEA